MNLSLNQKIALGFLVLILTYGGMGYISLNNLERSRAITNKNLLINQPSIILLNELKLMVVNSRNFSGTWVTLDISNNPDKKALVEMHASGYVKLKEKMEPKIALWSNEADEDSIASVLRDFEEVLVMEKTIMSALPNIDAYQDFMVRVET